MNIRTPKKYAPIIEEVLSGKSVMLEKVDLTTRKILQRFARESGAISVRTVLVVQPSLGQVKKPKKKVNKNSVHFILAWDWMIIMTGYVLAYTLLF